jgi:hypothetical protein
MIQSLTPHIAPLARELSLQHTSDLNHNNFPGRQYLWKISWDREIYQKENTEKKAFRVEVKAHTRDQDAFWNKPRKVHRNRMSW